MFLFLLHVEAVIGLITQVFLFYAILRHTPSTQRQIKPLLLKMAFYEILAIIIGEGGLAPEDFFPLAVLRINGYLKFFGQEYGAYIGASILPTFYLFLILSLFETSLFRFGIICNKKLRMEYKWFIVSDAIPFFIIQFVIYYAATKILTTSEVIVAYAKMENINLPAEINFETDVLMMFDVCGYSISGTSIVLVAGIAAGAFLYYAIAYMTHRRIKQEIKAAMMSYNNYKQQRAVTIVLASQGAVPLGFSLVSTVFVFPIIFKTSTCVHLPPYGWKFLHVAIGLYPISTAIITFSLMKPYSAFLKSFCSRLFCRKKKVNVSVPLKRYSSSTVQNK